MNVSFRNALIISILLHSFLITPLYCLDVAKDGMDQKRPMTIDYMIMSEISKIGMERDAIKSRIEEDPRIELKKDPEALPVAPGNIIKDEATTKKQVEIQKAAKREAKIKKTKDYINYYHLIRENIRKKLKENYRYYYGGGDIAIAFTLNSKGGLVTYGVRNDKSTGDETLRHIATVSLIEAAPFQPFPKALAVPQMTFNLVVSFNKKQK